MGFVDVVKNRHSVRSFKDKEIEQEKLKKLLEIINSAPSAGDLQAYEIVLVKSLGKRKELARASYGQSFVAEAPLILVFIANEKRASSKYGQRGTSLYSIQDATIAASYAQLAATDLGLATVWVGAFDEKEVSRILNAQEHLKPIAIIPVGYANETPSKTPRRSLDDLVHEEEL